MTVPPDLASLVAGAINLRVISDHWFELLRLAMSIKTGTVTASVILRKLAAYPRQNGLALALRELGKLERTFFTLQWLQDPELRRRSHVGLNKGEQQNALRRAVFFNRLGEIRDRSYENQRHRASGLNLLVAAIILWNTTYLQRAVDHLRDQGHHPAPSDLAHLSPLGWEHINLTGDYHWDTSPTLGPDEFRPLRTHAHDFAAAA
jgi:TnpA family transposase